MGKNFMVNRDNVWIGMLYGSEVKSDEYDKYHMGDILLRYIVFTKDNNGLCHDIFYTTEDGYQLVFPEMGVEYDINVDRNTVVCNCANIGKILEALKCRQYVDCVTLGKAVTSIVKARFFRKQAKKLIMEHNLTKDDCVAFDIIKYQIIPNCYGKPNKLENIIKKS